MCSRVVGVRPVADEAGAACGTPRAEPHDAERGGASATPECEADEENAPEARMVMCGNDMAPHNLTAS